MRLKDNATARKGNMFTMENIAILIIAILAGSFMLKAGMAYQKQLYTPAVCVDTDEDPPRTYDIDACWEEEISPTVYKNFTCNINRKIIVCEPPAGGCTYGTGCDCVDGGIYYPVNFCKNVAGTFYSCERSRRSNYPQMVECPENCIDTIGCTDAI